MTTTLGFIGLGRMGARMASRLINDNKTVYVYDTNKVAVAEMVAKGAIAVEDLSEMALMARVVFTSLPDAAVVLTAIHGLLNSDNDAQIKYLVDLSTVGPKAAVVFSELLESRNIRWVEAPVSGGPKGAGEGTLAIMVSADKEAVEFCAPFLSVLGKVFEVGTQPGQAQTAKLANNMLSSAAVVITSEVMAMGAKAGLDPAVLLEVINAGSGRNSATVDKFPRSVLTGGFDYGFSTALAYKDIRLCVDESENMGVPMILGSVVRQMLAATKAQFGDQSDFTEVAKIYENWAGVQIRSPKDKE